MKLIPDLAESFVHTFRLERSRRKAGLCLLIWGILHLLAGCAYFTIVVIYSIKFSFLLIIPLLLCIMGLIMIRAAWRLIVHP